MSEMRELIDPNALDYCVDLGDNITGLPVICENINRNIADYETTVLMVAYANVDAVRKTIDTSMATFYSRSRQEIWTKGEKSGNILLVESIYVDCDSDTLLYQVNPIGPACHNGTKSCFETYDEGQ